MKKINYLSQIVIGNIYYISHNTKNFYPKFFVYDIYSINDEMHDVISVYLFDKDIKRGFRSDIPGSILKSWIDDDPGVYFSEMKLNNEQFAKLLLILEE